jgi:hypothetical protein
LQKIQLHYGNSSLYSFTYRYGIHFIDQTVPINTPLLFGISAAAGDGNLKQIVVQRTFRSKTFTPVDSTFNARSFTFDFHTIAIGADGPEIWVFKIFDTSGVSATVTLTITTTLTKIAEMRIYSTKVKK